MTNSRTQEISASSHEEGLRRRIVRTRRLILGALDQRARASLVEQCYAIYAEISGSLDRAEFTARFFSDDRTCVGLFLGQDGELAGFSNVTFMRVVHDDVEHAVISAGAYTRLKYRGGDVSARFGLIEALRFKLRHPLTPLAYLAMASTPAPYCLYLRTLRRVYPGRREATPPEIEALVREVIRIRSLTPLGDTPWLVRTFVQPRHVERLRSSQRLKDDPEAAFYVAQNPTFATTAEAALLVWMPLDIADLLGAFARGLAAAVKRVGGRGRG